MRNKKNGESGSALFITLAVLTFLAVCAFGIMAVSTSNSRISVNKMADGKAYYYARLGVSKAIDEIEHDYWWGTSGTQTFTAADGEYIVTVWAPQSNLTSADKKWIVTSVGRYQTARREITVWLQLESFAKFAYFTDRETSGSTTIWFTDRDTLTGSIHTNGYYSIYRNPRCSSSMTSHNENDSSYNPATRFYTQNSQTYSDPVKFYRYYNGYSTDYPAPLDSSPNFSFAGGQPDIPLPTDTSAIENKADNTFQGDVKLTFSDAGTVVVQPVDTSRETVTLSTDNLTVFVNGTIFVMGGTLKGKATFGSSGDIRIKNSIVYKNKNTDVLGFVAENDIIINKDPYSTENVEIDAIMMAISGSFYVADYSIGIPRGTLKIFGGLIQNERGPVGTFNSSTGSVTTGYNKNYEYDTKLINTPPPNYPTTGNIRVLCVKDNAALY